MSYRTFGYWVKFSGAPPERWQVDCFEQFWHRLRDHMLRNDVSVEWIIAE